MAGRRPAPLLVAGREKGAKVTSIEHRPRIARLKALIAVGLASLAMAGAVQASIPDPASAQKLSQCMRIYVNIAETFYNLGYPDIGQKWLEEAFLVC